MGYEDGYIGILKEIINKYDINEDIKSDLICDLKSDIIRDIYKRLDRPIIDFDRNFYSYEKASKILDVLNAIHNDLME